VDCSCARSCPVGGRQRKGERLCGDRAVRRRTEGLRHHEELIRRAVSDPENLATAQGTAKQIESVQQYGIAVPVSDSVASFEATVTAVGEDLLTLQSQFPEQLESLRPSLEDLPLAVAHKTVGAEVKRCVLERNTSLAEWQRLERTLHLLGISRPEAAAPRTLTGLKEQIQDFRMPCSAKVGEEGMSLLAFLHGDADFPSDLTLDTIKRALLSLRPLIVVSSRTGVQDAQGG